MTRRLWLHATLAAVGCDRAAFDLSGLPCEPGGCVTGYECRPDTQTCQPDVARGCDRAASVCWEDTRTGDACAVEGGYLPCGDGTGCDHGCRTCQGGAWSHCQTSDCSLGLVASCGSCTDNCAVTVENADPDCDTRGAANSCSYRSCVPGFFDADEVRRNGCECRLSGAELCNGIDDDCNGGVDDNRDIDATCFVTLPAAVRVRRWSCEARCVIEECEPGWIDADATAATGCETPCAPTGGPERCDGLDNDCNGLRDDVADVGQDCAQQLAAATNVAAWSCAAGACAVSACVTGWTDSDGDPSDGCETPCTPTNGGVERCDGIDNDCDGERDDVAPATLAAFCDNAHPGAQAVASWRCVNAACAPTCDPNRWDNNASPGDGCEYTCTATGPEICDGSDNDCDGDTDTLDGDLDEQSEQSAVCASTNPQAGQVTAWRCQGDACVVVSCAPGYHDENLRASDGCEYACTPAGPEVCDAGLNDEDCNGAANDGENRSGCTTYYLDADGDLIGRPHDSRCLCFAQGDYDSTIPGDCTDDGSASGIDCDVWYRDRDGDGYGDPGQSRCWCTPADDYTAASAGDCDDRPSPGGCGTACNPGIATETCGDGYDNDCNAGADDGCIAPTILNSSNSGLVSNDVRCIAVDVDSDVAVGTGQGGGASRMNAGQTTFTTQSGLNPKPIRDCVFDRTGAAWFSYVETDCDNGSVDDVTSCTLPHCGPSRAPGSGGATYYCTDYMSQSVNGVRSMAADPDTGDVYLGTDDDYAIFKAAIGALDCDIQIGGTATESAVCYDAAVGAGNPRTLYLATGTELVVCAPNHDDNASVPRECADACVRYDLAPSAVDALTSLAFDDANTPADSSDDLLWVGSSTLGVFRVAVSGSPAVTGSWSGTGSGLLPSVNVSSIAVDRARRLVWVGTNAGLARYSITEGEWTTYTTSQGLASNIVSAVAVAPNGTLWIGTDAGVVRALSR